jgi:hypothetical protein
MSGRSSAFPARRWSRRGSSASRADAQEPAIAVVLVGASERGKMTRAAHEAVTEAVLKGRRRRGARKDHPPLWTKIRARLAEIKHFSSVAD